MMTLDCLYLLNCEIKEGKGSLTKSPVNLVCHEHASCGLRGGYPSCACKPGFFGDGAHSCYRKYCQFWWSWLLILCSCQ